MLSILIWLVPINVDLEHPRNVIPAVISKAMVLDITVIAHLSALITGAAHNERWYIK